MSLALNNRLDIVILSSEEKPTVNLKNGSTLYEVDTAKLYVWYEGNWYDEEGSVVEENTETEETETNDSNRSIKISEVIERKETEEAKVGNEEVVEKVVEDVVEDDNK